MAQLRKAVRPVVAVGLWPLVRPFRRTIERGRDGRRLAPGISVAITARNEAYTIPLCLRSLLGFADQIICVDNGSQDGTLQAMEAFRHDHFADARVEVVSMPDALLRDCREEGLTRARHQWHVRWDGDLVARTSGPDSISGLREYLLADDRPQTVHLPYINLSGDLRHTQKLKPVRIPGEPRLMRFGRGIAYTEFGAHGDEPSGDRVRPPLYYRQVQEARRFLFHLAGLKPDDSLMHRMHYFAWRDEIHRKSAASSGTREDFQSFKHRRNADLFGTVEPRAVKFRFRRQFCYHMAPYDPQVFGDYPEVLSEELTAPQRFEVIYRNGRPWTRIDHEDEEMLAYEPTHDDLEWDPEPFLRRLHTPQQCQVLGLDASTDSVD